jgi:thiosulfate reductase cytochrome b subunit
MDKNMKNITLTRNPSAKLLLLLLVVLSLGLTLAWGINLAFARGNEAPAAAVSPIHPAFAFLDEDGTNVLESSKPISTMQTCGKCHDSEFIASHSFHADLGLSNYGQSSDHAWDASNGLFGKFDPIANRYLSQPGDERTDLTTAEWLMLYGWRVPGGGPAVTSREGKPLASLNPAATNPETSILDPKTGNAKAWNWSQSGTVEMDCFLCHFTTPNNAARTAEIQSGKFGWANTATLEGTGIVTKSGSSYTYNAEAFTETGELKEEFILIQDPTNANCAQCHGVAHSDTASPLVIEACDTTQPQTATTGQVIAPERIDESGLNISGKKDLGRSWDIHAERDLKCTDCHYALNNPAHYQEALENKPAHLLYDPRRLEIGEYLTSPDHNFARGQSAQFTVAPELKGTMRRCDSCHDSQTAHTDWLPYTERHMTVVACETCHIPQMYAPAIESYDWTVVKSDGSAASNCRGIEGSSTVTDLVTGYQPVLMQRKNVDGKTLLAPYNLVTTWFWIYDDANGNTRPVRQLDLQAVYLKDGGYASDILSAFDLDGNGQLSDTELVLDTVAKQTLVTDKLTALGLKNPRIYGQVQPYSINHNVTRGDWVISDCETCHTSNSRVSAPIQLASNIPGGVMPEFVKDSNVSGSGELVKNADGSLSYQPMPANDKIYVFGKNRIDWIDWLGALAFAGVVLGVGTHGTLRYMASLRRPKHAAKTKKVQMYDAYERFWHWLQTLSIVFLLFTGLVIHRPDIFGIFSFRYIVTIHNVLAAILVINAVLSLFWHVVSGEIRQYIPRPRGFFDDAIVQAKFYIDGIFKHDPHPFEKTKDKKLNPLQQATYFGLLNVLLPLQIITGALMWGVQKVPAITNLLGGLPVLAPFHSLVAWLFGAFIVAHVYLTTTGATPLEAMRGMVTGWEELEVHGKK